jgi:hypothetical protein
MSELDDLEQLYLSKDGTPAAQDAALPPGFRELLGTLESDPSKCAADQQTRLANVRRLIGQLDSADNGAVKMQKRRVIRAELNALRQIESLES